MADKGKHKRSQGDSGAGKKRKESFTSEENETLVEKILLYYNGLFGAAVKKTSQGKKDEMWEKITDAVNAVGGNGRTVYVVKKRYFDVKRQIRRKVARVTHSTNVTSEGPAEYPYLSDYEKEFKKQR